MKLSEYKSNTLTGWKSWLPAILWLWTLAIITVPNIGLEITDTLLPDGLWGTVIRVAFVILPLGCYMLILTSTHKVGKAFWIVFPLVFLSAFQVVLLDLFGSQPIAVDMWLNLVTTNSAEASELLGSLLLSMILLTVGYIPAIVLAVIATRHHWRLPRKSLHRPRTIGFYITIVGLAMTAAGFIARPSVSMLKSFYPVNVIYNAYLAGQRTMKVANYHTTSANFTFDATSEHPDSLAEVYVLVIGETARADHFQLYGYDRPTTPGLMARANRIAYMPNTISESNTTHKSVPMLLSALDARTFEDSVYTSKGILTAFKEAGFHTLFISNQGRNGSFIDFFGEEADMSIFLRDEETDGLTPHDTDMLAPLKSALAARKGEKIAIVLHAYGSHFKYDDRYPADFDAPFPVVGHLEATPKERDNLVNAYDNTIAYTDTFLSAVTDILEATGRPAAMVYASDHGEDIYDDALQRFLHASPLPTYPQVRVPMIIWCSTAYDAVNPEALANARHVGNNHVSSSRSVFHTMLDLAGITTRYFHPDQSVVNKAYKSPHEPLYLNDHNEAVALDDIVMTP